MCQPWYLLLVFATSGPAAVRVPKLLMQLSWIQVLTVVKPGMILFVLDALLSWKYPVLDIS
jgi:hypothetical protein